MSVLILSKGHSYSNALINLRECFFFFFWGCWENFLLRYWISQRILEREQLKEPMNFWQVKKLQKLQSTLNTLQGNLCSAQLKALVRTTTEYIKMEDNHCIWNWKMWWLLRPFNNTRKKMFFNDKIRLINNNCLLLVSCAIFVGQMSYKYVLFSFN